MSPPLDADRGGQRLTDRELLRRIGARLAPERRALAVVLTLTPLGVLAQVLQPWLLQVGIDDHIRTGDHRGLLQVAGLFALAVLGAWLSASVGNLALQRLSLRALARLRADLFDHVTGQGAAFFDRRHAGSLMTRTINDVDTVYESLARGAIAIFTNGLMIIGMLAAMLLLSPALTLTSFAFSPVLWLIVRFFRLRLRPVSAEIRDALSRLNGYFAERVFGMTTVQTGGAEAVSQGTFDAMSLDYMRAYHRANWLDAGLYAVMDGMSSLATAAIVWYAASSLGVGDASAAEAISVGLVVAFIDYLGRIFVPIRDLSGQIASLQRSFAALDKIFALLDTDERIPDTAATAAALSGGQEAVRGEVSFEGVSFGYRAGAPDVLHAVDLSLAPGEVVAIVGATGSGKSTLGKLLLRMYDGYRGDIRIDGRELRSWPLERLRDTVTVVHQDAFLLEASLADNVRLGDDRISDAALAEAARLAQAEGFVARLPEGWATRCSGRGQDLSAGERQLIALTRAFARAAPIVVLDEATASVDAMTERRIDLALENLFRSRTVLVIAHRLQTIQRADRIIVLDNGRVVERGDHATLMALGGRYRHLVETGFAGEAAEGPRANPTSE
jgi:ATP-binding cassette subfamily B multidrug efflux pump